jgi:hypothetical protein
MGKLKQQQAASQTLDQLRGASGEMQPYLQAHFISAWNEIVTSYEVTNLLLILDAAGEAFASLRNR